MDAAALLIAALLGGGGVAGLLRLLGPERTSQTVGYQLELIKGLQDSVTYYAKENGRLMGERSELITKIDELEKRVEELELHKDDPPPHLG